MWPEVLAVCRFMCGITSQYDFCALVTILCTLFRKTAYSIYIMLERENLNVL